MALKILYQHVNGTLTADISAATTLIPIDSATLSLLNANVNFGGGDWTYLLLDNGVYSEEIKAIGISTPNLVVERAKSGSTAQAFAVSDTVVTDRMGGDAIKDIIAANPNPTTDTFTGTGLVNITAVGTAYQIGVDAPTFTGTDGISVLGSWPNYQISYEGASEGCCGGGSGGSGSGGVDQVVVVSSILQASIAGSTLTLTLPSPTFTGGGGVTVSGSWADGYTITGSGGGGTGTVTSVGAGTGLVLTGAPNVNPTLSLAATGVSAGTYGGFSLNAQGQITHASSGYNPIGSIAFANGANVTVTGTGVTVTMNVADVGVQGIVALADSGSPLSASDDSTAVTPKLLSTVISGIGASLASAGSSTGEADGSYTNTISGSAITVTVPTGKKALIIGEVECTGGTTNPENYGVAVFNSGSVKLYGSKITAQAKQSLLFTIGPGTTTMSLVTTALSSGGSATSYFLAAVVI